MSKRYTTSKYTIKLGTLIELLKSIREALRDRNIPTFRKQLGITNDPSL